MNIYYGFVSKAWDNPVQSLGGNLYIRKVEKMKPENLLKLQDQVEEMAEEARTLWSTLEAVHDAMAVECTNPITYRDAIYGTSKQARRLKEELESLMVWLEEREKAEESLAARDRREL